MREHLDVDAGLVHLGEAPLAELEHAVDDCRIGLDSAEMLDQLVVVVMLLDRDDRTIGLLQHGLMFPRFYANASYQRPPDLSRC